MSGNFQKQANRTPAIRNLALTGVMAALITVLTAFFIHIPIGVNGGYIHLGDTLIYIAAAILPAPYACAAAAIGGGFADLLTAPVWIIPTMIIKTLIVLPFSSGESTILTKRNRIAPWIALAITAVGYYAAEAVIFGSVAALFTSITGSLIQSGASALFFYIIGAVFDKNRIKQYFTIQRKRPDHG